MITKNTIRIAPLLFDFLGWIDYNEKQNWPIREIAELRSSFIMAIWNNDTGELREFCKQVIRLQQYRYQLNGTAGVETRSWIPKELEQQFVSIPFDPKKPITVLPKTISNQDDPGIVLQQCLFSEDLQKILSIKVSQMTDPAFIYFSEMIDALEWFAAFQSPFWFTYHPERIPSALHHHFWFIDEHYLGEKHFVHES